VNLDWNWTGWRLPSQRMEEGWAWTLDDNDVPPDELELDLGLGLGGLGVEEEREDEEAEAKYLTMTWWILHVGWKDVGERVRRAVEEIFGGLSLKTKLTPNDLHRLIYDVRRRVELEVTFEGHEKNVAFDSTLLPLTPETISHVLVQGGFSPSHPPHYQPIGSAYQPPRPSIFHQDKFTTLLTRTLNVISSSDFAHVLDVCLDRATEVLFSSISPSAGGEWEFGDPSTADKGAGASTMNERVRLAALLPGLARWSQLALEGLPNVLVDNVLGAREAEALSAIVFAKFEDEEGVW